MDELAMRREGRKSEQAAWFMTEWERLNDGERAAIGALIEDLHDRGLRRNPAAVAWLAERFC